MSDGNELIAAWMMKEGFATGHGDTAEELLEELSWQIAEIKAQRDELLEALEELFCVADCSYYGDAKFAWNPSKARAAVAKAKGE
jgi:hypothetical protein